MLERWKIVSLIQRHDRDRTLEINLFSFLAFESWIKINWAAGHPRYLAACRRYTSHHIRVRREGRSEIPLGWSQEYSIEGSHRYAIPVRPASYDGGFKIMRNTLAISNLRSSIVQICVDYIELIVIPIPDIRLFSMVFPLLHSQKCQLVT